MNLEFFLRVLLWTLLAGLLLAVPSWTRTHQNVRDLETLQADLDRIQAEVEQRSLNNSRLIDRIHALNASEVARRDQAILRYNLVREDEIVIRFSKED